MSICPAEYWIWLQTALGAGAQTSEILAYFETPEKLYLAGSHEWRLSGLFTEKKIQALKSSTPSQTGAVFKEYFSGRISSYRAGEMLNSKVEHLPKLESAFFRGIK